MEVEALIQECCQGVKALLRENRHGFDALVEAGIPADYAVGASVFYGDERNLIERVVRKEATS